MVILTSSFAILIKYVFSLFFGIGGHKIEFSFLTIISGFWFVDVFWSSGISKFKECKIRLKWCNWDEQVIKFQSKNGILLGSMHHIRKNGDYTVSSVVVWWKVNWWCNREIQEHITFKSVLKKGIYLGTPRVRISLNYLTCTSF